MRSALSACIKLFNIMACVLLLAMVVVMFLAIVMRQFGVLIPGSEEIATFSMVGVAFLGLPGVYTAGMHVRVETLYSRLAAPRQKALDIWCLAVAIAVCLVFAYFTGLLAWDSYRLGDAAFGLADHLRRDDENVAVPQARAARQGRGRGDQPRQVIAGGYFGNARNAVKLDGAWRLPGS